MGHFAGRGAGGLIFTETPKDLQLGFGRLGYGRDGLGADDGGVLVAGFEAFELFESGVEGAAGGVDAVL